MPINTDPQPDDGSNYRLPPILTACDIPLRQIPAVELCAEVLAIVTHMAATEPSWRGVTVEPLTNGALASVVRRNGRDVCVVRVKGEGAPMGEISIDHRGGNASFREFWLAADYISGLI